MAKRSSFGSEFAAAFQAMMKLSEDERYHRAMEAHYARQDWNAGSAERERQRVADIAKAGAAGATIYEGGGANVSKNLDNNQREAYQAAVGEGLSDGAARALVANMSGEALADPSNVHKDGPHYAHGIVQWDDDRSAAIARQFGKMPQAMTVAEQTKAAIWEMKTNPAYAQTWRALNSNASPQDMVKTLVTNYERPGDPDKSITQRLQHLGNLSTDLSPSTAVAGAPTKAPAKGDVPSAEATAVEADTASADGKFALPGSSERVGDPASAGAGRPDTGAPPPGSAIPKTLPSDQGPGPAPAPAPVGSEPPGTQFARPDAPGVGRRGLPPAPGTQLGPESPFMPPDKSVYNPGTEPNTNFVRPTGAAMGPTRPIPSPQMGPEGGGATELPLEYSHMPPQQNVRGQTAVGSRTQQDVTPSVTERPPATSSRAIPSQPAQDPRFVQITAPNSDPTARNRPQMTALNLNLWGANPPVDTKRRQGEPAPSTSQGNTDDWQGVASAPDPNDLALGMQIQGGYAKGGAIPAGPTMGYAGGASVTPAQQQAAIEQMGGSMARTIRSNQANQAYGKTQNNDLYTAARDAMNNAIYGNGVNGSNFTAQQHIDAFNKMTPDQQKWYNNSAMTIQQAQNQPYAIQKLMLQGIGAMPPSTPTTVAAAATPAAQVAAAAPATPSVVTPAKTAVNPAGPADTGGTPTTGADTTTTKTTTGLFKQPDLTAPTTSWQSRDPGSQNFTNTQNTAGTNYDVGADATLKETGHDPASGGGFVAGFDDGGGVGPMPPGAGGQAPPPIYYNPATYSPAGAPIGRGITHASAPTAVAGAIPSLPMRKGGAVAFADGGDVMDDYEPEPAAPAGEQVGYAAESGNARGAAPVTQQGNPYATATDPSHVDPNLPQWTPQVKDADGNPSKGVIGAISGGLHYLASQLGLSGGGQQQGAIPGDPQTQMNRQAFSRGEGVPGAPMPEHEEVSAITKGIGAGGLMGGMRTLAGMEAVRNYYLVQGDVDKADRMSASMLQYSVALAQKHGDEAARRYYDGDLKGAVDQLNQASDSIADGNDYKATLSEDGKSVEISNRDLNGKELWKQKVAPSQILGAALGMKDGSLAWSAYEHQAAKYDPAYNQLAAERRQQRAWDHQQSVLDAKEKAKSDAADAAAASETAVLEGMHKPAIANGPTLTPPGNPPAISPTPQAPTPAPPKASQAGADVNPATGIPDQPTPVASSVPVTPTAPAPQDQPPQNGPAPPTPPDVPTPNAQTASGERLVSSFTEPPPTRPDQVEGYARLSNASKNSVWKSYQAEYANWKQSKDQRDRLDAESRTADRTSARDDLREQRKSEAAATLSKDHDARLAAAEDNKQRLGRTEPMPEDALQRRFNTNPDPATGMAGKTPADWLATSYNDGAPDDPDALTKAQQKLGAAFDDGDGKGGKEKVARLGEALVNTQRFNAHMNTSQIADFVHGVATGSYAFSADPKPISDVWGNRYSVAYARPDGSMGALIVPEDDMNNIIRIQKEMAKRNTAKTATAPAVAPAPTPNAEAFPGTRGALSPTSQFGGAPQAITPNQQWWLDSALGKNRSAIPAFPTPNPEDRGGRGYIN